MKPPETSPNSSLEQAAEWIIRQQEAPLSYQDKIAFEHWKNTSKANQKAWLMAEKLMGDIESLPKDMAIKVLNRPDSSERRYAIGKLALLLAAGPSLWGGYQAVKHQQWFADYRTAKGEFKKVTLPDGSTIKLNTATAFNIELSKKKRLLTLKEGEIDVQIASNPHRYGPFLVNTQEVELTPIGQNIAVRQEQQITRVVALKGDVYALPHQKQANHPIVISAGTEASLSRFSLISNTPIKALSTSWLDHMIAVNNMPLAQFIKEVSRYRHGIIRVSPNLADLAISGAFPNSDTNIILTMLSHTYPIEVKKHFAGYWVSLEKR
ncbi:FecR domain-containing protein [Marinomonas aquiplantarum]|uniref:FecR family protein n=1 Tax=Marinomonas aquiplantarum TaxID=491951 RepID=A0A366D403_9GAMM|nr:FecR family protein [Marinomonas aquiplantarum]RBO84665.1 FecR family protein [Marinomonas aquiplantarum]